MYLLGALVVGAILLGLLYVAFTASGGKQRGGAMKVATVSSAAQSAQQPPPSQYKGRPLVDDILRKRHGLSAGAEGAYSWAEVARHCKADDLWLVVEGKVYDVTDFVDEHPGGVDAIMVKPGQDNTAGFYGPQHPEKVQQLIGEYYIGRVAA